MRKRIWGGLLATVLALAGTGHTRASGLSDDGRVGMVADLQGAVFVQPAGRQRWSPLGPQMLLLPGDQVRTTLRGAHAAEIRLRDGNTVVLGAGTRVALTEPGALRLFSGDLEITGSVKHPLRVTGPGEFDTSVASTVVLRAVDSETTQLEQTPRWLAGYRASTTDEWMGSLVANVDGRDVPLSVGYHKVDVVIRDQIAVTTIEESFVNATDSRLEGVFSFPLPAGSSISGFGMWIGDELVQADIVERQRAREIYEDIRRRRKDPGLLEWSGGNLFKASVFPIEAHSEKRIRIRYTQVLPLEGSRVRYRYALRSDLLRTNPLRELALTVRNHSQAPIESATSPTHDVTVTQTRHDATLTFQATEYTPERDFEVVFGLEQSTPLRVVPHRRGDDGYFMLLFSPPDPLAAGMQRELTPEGAPLDVVFVADTSASMGPAARREQRDFLAAALALLGPEDQFRVMACDATVAWMRGTALPVTDENVELALASLERRASLGWTDLDLALATAAEHSSEGGLVVYMGDGIGTTGDADPVALAKRIAKIATPAGVSFHAVATGSAFEEGVLDAIASLGGGSARGTEGDPARAAYTLLAEVAQPSIKDLAVSFEGLRTARVYPEQLPSRPAGTQQVVLGRFLPGPDAEQHGAVTLTGTLAGKPVRYTAQLALAADEDGNSFLPRLWARKHLDALLAEGRSPAIQEEIVSFSERFGIMTPYTSFLVLESDEDRERYGVTRRVHMRDGDRFFAQARSAANTAALREQVAKARSWRLSLRRRMLAEVTGLGRGLYTDWGHSNFAGYAYGAGGGAGGGRPIGGLGGPQTGGGDWGGATAQTAKRGSYRGPAGELADEEFERAELEEEFPPDSREPSDPPPPPGEPMYDEDEDATSAKQSFASQRGRAREMGAAAKHPAGPTSGGGAGGRFSSNAPFHRFPEGLARRDQNPWLRTFLHGRFPVVPPPTVRPAAPPDDSPFSDEILTILEPVSAPPTLAPGTVGGIEVSYVETGSAATTNGAPARTARTLIGTQTWFARFRQLGQESNAHWLADERGASTGGTRLGRRRPGTEEDRDDWAPFTGRQNADYTRGYGTWTAEIVAREGALVSIRLAPAQPNTYSQVIVVDTERHVVVRSESFDKDQLTSSRRTSDWVLAGGLWWAENEWSEDAAGNETWRRTLSVNELTAEAFGSAFSAEHAAQSDVIFLAAADPELVAAKQALHDGAATLADHLVIAGDHAAFQRWDEAWAAFEEARLLAGDKPGMDWIATLLYAQSRRGEQFAAHVQTMVESLTQDRYPAETRALAWMLLNDAASYEGHERLTLSDALMQLGTGHDTRTDPWWARQWDRQRAALLFSLGEHDAAIAVWRRLWDDNPEDPQDVTALLNALAQTGDVEGALEVLAQVKTDGAAWQPQLVAQVYRQLAYVLWNAMRYDELSAVVARWIDAAPSDAQAYHIQLTTLLSLGRIEEVDAWVGARFDAAADVGIDAAGRAQLSAAVSIALGDEWNGRWSSEPIDERWALRLSEVARLLARTPDADLSQVMRIVQHHRYQQTDASLLLTDWLRADLVADGVIETMDLGRLQQSRYWLQWGRDSVDATIWRDVTDRVIERWRGSEKIEDRRALFQIALSLLDAHVEPSEAVELLREAIQSAEGGDASAYTRDLLQRLATLTFSVELEDELFALLPQVVIDEAPDVQKQNDFSAYAHWLADNLFRMRVEATLGPAEEREKLPRAELRANQRAARAGARRSLAERLALASKTADDLLRPWYEIERISYLAELAESTDVEGEARELLLSAAAAPRGAEWVLLERSVLALSYVAARREAPDGLTERVVALFRERLAADDDSVDWRYAIFRLLVVLDRPVEVEAALRAWIVPSQVESRWRIALGYLMAELERLDEAAPQFEEVARLGELGETEYLALADWYLVTDDDAARQSALERRYSVLTEYELANLVNGEYYRLHSNRSGSQLPADMDDEVLRVIRVMLTKTSRPDRHIGYVYSLYRAVKDFRLLTFLADGIVGHTPGAIYPYLTQTNTLMNQVHEEATCDEVRRRVVERLETVTTDTDRRGLTLLLSQVERRAAEVLDQPGPHLERALRHLQAARKGTWQPGEIRLMAAYLAELGQIPHAALAKEQLVQLDELHDLAEPGTVERLRIAQHLYMTRWAYGELESSTDGLGAALDEYRGAVGGVLPASVNDLVSLLTDWSEHRGHFTDGESRLLAARERQPSSAQRQWYERRLHRLYVRCLRAGGTVSIGSGIDLYRASRDLMQRALADHAPDHLSEVMDLYCTLHREAKEKRIGRVRDDLVTFSQTLFPELMPRFGANHAGYARRVAHALRDVAGRPAALRFLIERLEAEPEWFRRRNADGWYAYGGDMAQWRRELGASIGDLEARLFVIVLRELERDLVTERGRGRYMYGGIQNREFWTARKSDFVGVAERVLAEHAESPSHVLYVAYYLWNDLELRDAAISALAAADGRGALREDGRWQLVQWLRETKRWAELLLHAEQLVREKPDNLNYRVENVRALHGLGRDGDGRALVSASYERLSALFESQPGNLWQVAPRLAEISRECTYFDLAVPYFSEAIRAHERRTRGRVGAGGDWQLSSLYGSLATAHAGLEQFDEAVDAAASAVVVMGSRSDNRANALGALRSVMNAMPDLDAWATRYDAEVEETGLDAPVLRRALAHVYIERKQPAQAVVQLNAALEHDPDDLELRSASVRAAEMIGDPAGVIAALEASLFHVPAQPKLYATLAGRLHGVGDADGAERALTGLAEYAPNEAEGHRELAELRGAAGRWTDAVVQWRQVVRIRTREVESWLGLAAAQAAAGDVDGARETLDEVFGLPWASEGRKRIEAARAKLGGPR